MKKIGVIVNRKRPHASAVLDEVKTCAAHYGFELFAEDEGIATLLEATHLPTEQFGATVDVVLSLGGDGTVLYTARALYGSKVPIMGINLGSLGFLTGMGDQEICRALQVLSEGSYKRSERMVACCRIERPGAETGHEHALNDVVLGWGVSSRIVSLRLKIDDEPVGQFMCDGIIVATPTGSTGHCLSAGGPIVHPGFSGFVINVICPHTLSSRPLIVPDESSIEIEVEKCKKELILSIDGQDEYRVQEGTILTIKRSQHPVTFLQLQEHNYFNVLSQKLHWRGSSL
jgi:NAD+ kinase